MSYKYWVLIAIGLFGIGVVLGLAGLFSEELSNLGKLGSILTPFKLGTVILIFIKNAIVLLLSFVLSPILCLTPILALTVNGWVLGLVSPTVAGQKSIGFVLAGLLPHGIFEIPALFIGGAAALSFGIAVMVATFKKEKRSLLPSNLKQNLRYLGIAMALLLIAAVIETYVTPLLIR
jgi:stage II sporulation protein M